MNRTAESRVSRRRPRFALLTLLVLVTAIAVALGLFTPEWHFRTGRDRSREKCNALAGTLLLGCRRKRPG